MDIYYYCDSHVSRKSAWYAEALKTLLAFVVEEQVSWILEQWSQSTSTAALSTS